MTPKQIYCMGRAEYLAEYEEYSLIEGYEIAEKEWNERNWLNQDFEGGKQYGTEKFILGILNYSRRWRNKTLVMF